MFGHQNVAVPNLSTLGLNAAKDLFRFDFQEFWRSRVRQNVDGSADSPHSDECGYIKSFTALPRPAASGSKSRVEDERRIEIWLPHELDGVEEDCRCAGVSCETLRVLRSRVDHRRYCCCPEAMRTNYGI